MSMWCFNNSNQCPELKENHVINRIEHDKLHFDIREVTRISALKPRLSTQCLLKSFCVKRVPKLKRLCEGHVYPSDSGVIFNRMSSVTASCPIYFFCWNHRYGKESCILRRYNEWYESKLSVSLTGEHKYNVHFFRWVQ